MKAKKWIKLPAIRGGHIGCSCCGYTPEVLPLDTLLYLDFGGWIILKDDVEYYAADADEKPKQLSDIENDALTDPDHDWKAWFNSPLRDATYQRHDKSHWVLVKKGIGFA